MNQGNSSLNASSLIDLKAELHKKYEAFRNVKNKQSNAPVSKGTHFKIKGEPIKEKKIPLKIIKPKEIDSEEELAFKKSREALEAKAKLYDKIVSNNILIDDEQKDNYLVDFQRKVLYDSPESSKEEEIKESEHKVSTNTNIFQNEAEPGIRLKSHSCVPELDPEETDQPIHYQNVEFDEARDYGTGYYSFSKNESKRKEQMEELRSARQETEDLRLKSKKLMQKRKDMLQARLAKICERKRIDKSVLESYIKNEDTEIVSEENIDLSAIPLPEMNSKSEDKPQKVPKIRPWDIGKDNLQHFVSAKKIKSENQWIEERRQERATEFAPPSTYM